MITIKGLDEFEKEIAQITKRYPDAVEKHVSSLARKLKKFVKEETPQGKEDKKANKKLINNYKVDPVKKSGKDYYAEFYSKSPHFHLVDRGHWLVKNGKRIRYVHGKNMLKKGVKKLDDMVVKDTERWIKKVTRELR